MNKKFVTGLTTVLFMLGMAGTAYATTISLDFNSLPSTQGWTGVYSGGSTEANTFSVAGGILTINTIGGGLGGSNAASGSYEKYGVVNANPFTISFRARILQEETSAFYTPQTFYFRASPDGIKDYFVVLGTSQINLTGKDFYSLDGTQFHDYVLSATPGIDAFTVTVDNSLVFNGTARVMAPGNVNVLDFGDGSSTGNLHGEITSYVFSQNSVPEPATIFLFSAGLVGLIWAKKRKSNNLEW